MKKLTIRLPPRQIRWLETRAKRMHYRNPKRSKAAVIRSLLNAYCK
jgi:hypothetical protein